MLAKLLLKLLKYLCIFLIHLLSPTLNKTLEAAGVDT